MDAESNLAEVAVSSNNGSTSGEPKDPTVLKEKLADELKSAASLKGGGDGPALDVPLEKDDLLERLDKIETNSNDTADAAAAVTSKPPGTSGSTNDADMENDDLIQRLEAMEKGEDESTAAKDDAPAKEEDKKKKDEAAGEPVATNHQNGLEKENEEELLQDEEASKDEAEEKMEVDGEKEEKKDGVSSTEPTSNGDSKEEQTEQPTSSAKRRHSQDEESQATEPSTKKPHVDEQEEVDAPEEDEPSKQVPEEKVEPEAPEASKTEETDKEASEKPKSDSPESDKTEQVSASEPSATEDVSKEKLEEQKPSDESAPPPDLDPTKDEEKKVEEVSNEKKEAKEPEEAMEVSEPVEEPAKNEEDVSVSEQKEEVDSTAAIEPTAESSKEVTETISAAAEAEDKVDPEPADKKKESAEEETKASEKVEEAVKEKPSEEKVEQPVNEVQESVAPEKVEDVKEPEEIKPVEDEPAPSEPAEEEPAPSEPVEEKPAPSESVQEKPAPSEPVEEKPAPSEPVEDIPKPTEEEKPQPEQPAAEAAPKSVALSDTEPNTESSQEELPTSSSPALVEEKTDDAISSSSEKKEEEEPALPSSTEVDSAVSAPEPPVEEPSEAETVTSSDEKPPSEAAVSQEVDSTPDVAPAATSEPIDDEEPMEVDSQPVAETSTAKEVSEPPCTKKEAYECTDESADKVSEAKPQEAAVESVPESASEPLAEPESVKAAEDEDEKMEVDSAAPTQSKPDPDVTESMNTTSEELIESIAKNDTATVADSQSDTAATVSELNKNLDATDGAAEESKVDASKTLDDSIECSLPTSSSDKMADRLKQRLDLISNGSSTPNAAVSSSNVYNSTPIQKQFEISSENVSKISRHSVDNSHHVEEEHSAITVGDQSSISEEKEAVVASTSGVSKPPVEDKKQPATDISDDTSISIKEGSSLKTESSEVDSCTASSALNTADEINMYAANARKFNGISSTSGSELEDKSTVTPTNVSTTGTPSTVVSKLELTPALTSEETLFEVSVWFDGTELQFLSIEKMENKSSVSGATAGSTQDLTGIDSSKQSSNGSVGSLGPFSLPPARPAAADSGMSHSTTTETSSGTSQLKSSLPKMKHTVRGAKALATLMIEEFTKIKRAFSKDDEISDAEPETPMKTPKGRPASAAKKSATTGRGQKRTRTDSDTTEEELPKSKQAAKHAKKGSKVENSSPSVDIAETVEPPAKKEDEQCCLARWSDRKYYAGRVTGYKGDNKFMVVFEDGASKALSKDVIVFGDMDTLPIMGHSIHALTGGDTYEPGIVQELKRNESNEVVYSVQIATGTVEVTASDMYLTEEQAKYINKACKAAEDAAMQSPGGSGRWGANTPIMQTPEDPTGAASAEKGSRSTRRRGADKPQTPVTPEAGYSGGVGKKGRRGRRLS